MNPDLTKMIKKSVEIYPNSKKEILTNGILIDKMDDEFWRTIKNANIEFGITKYPINIDQDIIEKNPKNLALIITMMLLNLICSLCPIF